MKGKNPRETLETLGSGELAVKGKNPRETAAGRTESETICSRHRNYSRDLSRVFS